MKLLADLPLGDFKTPIPAFQPVTTGTGVDAFREPFTKFLSNFIGFLTTLAGIMFLIYFIFAGLSWVTSGGDKGKVEKAKDQLTQAAIGLVVIIAAYGIVGVIGRVLGLDILNPVKIIETLKP
jgi:hypothetical protein